jgi:FAD binding domain-containing protein/FAD-dependent oxidoreductase family protein
MAIQDQLAKIVGGENVLDSPEIKASNGQDFSTENPGLFTCLVRPKTVAQAQQIIELANKEKFAVVPQSSRVHFHGAAVPKEAGVILDLSGMDKIVEMVEEPMVAYLQVGVTWEQFCPVLEEKGFTPVIPLLPNADRSVISDYLEREQPVIQNHESADPLQSIQLIWGNGEEFVTGSAAVGNFRNGSLADGVLPTGPGPMSYDTFLYGAQGTIGLATWGVVAYEQKATKSQAYFLPTHSAEEAIEPAYKILRAGICNECLLLNNINLATILTERWPDQFDNLRDTLPEWTLIFISRALKRRPDEKLAYEKECLDDIIQSYFRELDVLTTLPGVPAVEKKLPEMLRKPWPKERTYWKHAYRGGCEDLMFITTLERAPGYLPIVNDVAAAFQYATSDIGVYIQPLHDGHACEVTFSFFYDPDEAAEMSLVREMVREAATQLMEHGAYFTRPYPIIADIVYGRHGDQEAFLRRFKKHFDPNNIMNPGNLCF